MAFCSNCGTKAPDGVKFCPECGTRIMTAAQMNAAAAPAPQPVVEQPAPAPVAEAPKPVVEAPKPVVEAPKPVVEAPKPVVEAPKPVVEAPKPVVEVPKPVVERPAPKPIVERPAPAPVAEAPAPKAEPAPAPKAVAPAKFEVGEDGLEYVPYVPVANPQPLIVPGAKPAAKKPAPAPKAEPAPAAAPAAAPEVVDAPPAPKKAPKEPKTGIKKFLPFIIAGGVVLLAALIGIIVLVSSLLGKGGKVDENADPNLGLYNATMAEMMGFEMGVEDLWANGFSIELMEKGKAKLNIDGTEGKAKWTLEDGAFNVKGGGLDCSGTLENGEMVLENVMDMGVTLTFAKDGAMIDAPASPGELPGGDEPGVSAPASAIEEQWDGMWFGCVRFMECTGKYANYDYMNMDAFINIDVDANGKGTMQVYMGQDAGIPAFATAEIEAADYGIDTKSGKVLTFDMNTSSWMFRPTPDYEDRYVVYDNIEDGDGDSFEYMVFMKKWGNSWQPEIDTDFEIVPDSAAYYEECIAGGAAAPVISDNTALASSLEEATGSQLNLDGAAAPVGSAVTSEIAVPSTWYGWIALTDWWGDGEGEPMYDAWAFVDTDSEGRPFIDIKLDGYPDSAFMSMYMHLEDGNTSIVPEIGDGDAWFNDTYLTPGEDDNYRMYLLEDGTLCAAFTYVSYTGEYGCEVAMCFRVDGTEWDEENDLLPLRYDEYKAALGANTEGAPVDEPAAPVAGGDGIMEFDALKAGFKQVYDNGSGSTYAEIRDMFGGVDGKPKTIEDDFHSYRWATADDKSYVLVSFKVDETGLEKYSGVSWSSDLKD